LEEGFEEDGFVVLFVPGGEEECDGAGAGLLAEGVEGRGIFPEFGAVAFLEFWPLVGVVGEPFAQVVAGGDVLEPEIDGGALPGEAAGPEAVDEDADAVVGGLGEVDAFEADHGRLGEGERRAFISWPMAASWSGGRDFRARGKMAVSSRWMWPR
jgi:hypothetical protein